MKQMKMRTERIMINLIPFLILVSLIFVACSESVQLNATQKQGKRIYESLCDKCHKLIPPTNHTDTEWALAVNLYGTKLKLQQTEKNAVIEYLSLVNDK